MKLIYCLVAFLVLTAPCRAAEIVIHPASTVPAAQRMEPHRPDQLPHSRVATGRNDIAAAWLAGPTGRYPHGVLGDALEASRLSVETLSGNELHIELPDTRVFEDLEPRLVDLDGDSRDEIILVESDTQQGASLAIYGIVDGQLARRAATPFLGQANRWLNPLGWGDFDGDGSTDIAIVATPHIDGRLRIYRYSPPLLSLIGEYRGVSTHRIGSTVLGMGRVLPARPRDRLLLPDQLQRELLLLEWSGGNWRLLARATLPARLDSALVPSGEHCILVRVEDGAGYEIVVKP